MSQPAGIDYKQILRQAHAALTAAVAGVADDRWDAATPCSLWTVAQVLQHAVGDQLAYVAAITGGSGPDFNPFDPSGTLTEPADAFTRSAVHASAAAFATVSQVADAVPSPLPQGPMPAWLVLGAAALDAGVHAWDIGVATGRPSVLTPALASALLPVATAIVEPLRAYGAYAAALPGTGDDGEIAELLRYLGRDPGWSATSAAADRAPNGVTAMAAGVEETS